MWRIDFKIIREKKKNPAPAHQIFHTKEGAEETYTQLLNNEYLVQVQKPYFIEENYESRD